MSGRGQRSPARRVPRERAPLESVLLTTRIVVVLIAGLVCIPAAVWVFGDGEPMAGEVLAAALLALGYAVYTHGRVRSGRAGPWLPYGNLVVYSGVVTGLLGFFLLRAPASLFAYVPVLFMLYVLVVGATAVRDDPRLPLAAGGLCIAQLLAVTVVAGWMAGGAEAERAAAMEREFHPLRTVARVVLVGCATLLARVVSRRGAALHRRTMVDGLTGLLNRATFDALLDHHVGAARTRHYPVAVAMLDLDRFKDINDTRGHVFGDSVLRHVAEALRASLGGDAIVGRYGGEEFVAALPDLGEREVRSRLERLRSQVEALGILDPGSGEAVRVTLSTGVACWPDDGLDLGRVFRAADGRLYDAKNAGRNRVIAG